MLLGALATVAAVSAPRTYPILNSSVPSMQNGLPGEAMRGHKWIKAQPEVGLEEAFAAIGVMDSWTSGMFEAVVPPTKWDAATQLLEGRNWTFHAEDVQEMLENDKEARRRTPYKRGMRNTDFYRAWRNLPEIDDYIDFPNAGSATW